MNGYTSRFARGTRIGQSGNLLLNQLDGSLSGFAPLGVPNGEGWGVDQWLTVGPFDLIAEYLAGNFSPQGSTSFKEFTANVRGS